MTYHVNGKGEPGKCSAQQGNCPFGSDEDHYESQDQARIAFERLMQDRGWIKTSKVDRLREEIAASPNGPSPAQSRELRQLQDAEDEQRAEQLAADRRTAEAARAEKLKKARDEARERDRQSSNAASQAAANAIFFMG